MSPSVVRPKAAATDQIPVEERRAFPRYPYPCSKRVAFTDGTLAGTLPPFTTVQCHDISREGFSFYMRGLPSHTHVIAELGLPGSDYYFAEIRHMTPVERDGEWQMLLGCQFQGRVRL